MIYIYILLLTENKYYVGKTTNPVFRISDHFGSNGSSWTNKYQLVEVKDIIPNCDDFDEDKYTLKLMKEHGIENVRGGSFCQLSLDQPTLTMINRMLTGAGDECYSCGSKKHFTKNCLAYTRPSRSSYHSDIVYDECIKMLVNNEYIIKQAFEHDSGSGCYNVCYLTNFGDIIYSSYNQEKSRFDGPIKKFNYLDTKNYKNTLHKEINIEAIWRAKKYTFKSGHYFKLCMEYKNLIENNVVSYI